MELTRARRARRAAAAGRRAALEQLALGLRLGRDLVEPERGLPPRRAGRPPARSARRARRARPRPRARTARPQVELAAEPARRLLARRADRRVELLRGRLGVARRLARDGAAELLELPAARRRRAARATRCIASACSRSICSCSSRSRWRSRSASSCSARRRSAACASSSAAAAADDLLRRPLRAPRAASRSAPRCSSSDACSRSASVVDARLDLGRQLLLPLRDPRDLVGQALLELLEVGRSSRRGAARRRAAPSVSASASLRRRVALALGDVAPPLLGDPPLRPRRAPRATPRGRARASARARRRAARPRCATTSSNVALPRSISSSSVRRVARARRSAASVDGERPRRRRRAATIATTAAAVTPSRLGAPSRAQRRAGRRPGQDAQRALQRLDALDVSPSVRRACRTGVESVRCARLSAVAYAAASSASTRIVCASTKKRGQRRERRPTRARTTSRCGSGRRTTRGCRPGRGTRRRRRTRAGRSPTSSAAQTPIAQRARERDDGERDERAARRSASAAAGRSARRARAPRRPSRARTPRSPRASGRGWKCGASAAPTAT